MTNGSNSLMKVEGIAECSPWSIQQYFWPALSDNWSSKPILRSFREWLFYTDFYCIFSYLQMSDERLLFHVLNQWEWQIASKSYSFWLKMIYYCWRIIVSYTLGMPICYWCTFVYYSLRYTDCCWRFVVSHSLKMASYCWLIIVTHSLKMRNCGGINYYSLNRHIIAEACCFLFIESKHIAKWKLSLNHRKWQWQIVAEGLLFLIHWKWQFVAEVLLFLKVCCFSFIGNNTLLLNDYCFSFI